MKIFGCITQSRLKHDLWHFLDNSPTNLLQFPTICNIFATLNQKVYHLQHRHVGLPVAMWAHQARAILPMQPARMAESVDALVSNTSGAIRAGSIPAPGTGNPRRVISTRVFLFSFPTFSPNEENEIVSFILRHHWYLETLLTIRLDEKYSLCIFDRKTKLR